VTNILTAAAGTPALQINASGALSVTGDVVGQAYSLPVFIHQTTTTADNTCVWAMQNVGSATKKCYITNIDIDVCFAGTAGTGDTVLKGYSLEKFTTAIPAGGSDLTVIPHNTLNAATGVTVAMFAAAGLTMTNGVFSGPIANLMVPVDAVNAVAQFSLARGGREIVLAAGEGLCLLLEGTALGGLQPVGTVTWTEV
jgi:hypothetical protein